MNAPFVRISGIYFCFPAALPVPQYAKGAAGVHDLLEGSPEVIDLMVLILSAWPHCLGPLCSKLGWSNSRKIAVVGLPSIAFVSDNKNCTLTHF